MPGVEGILTADELPDVTAPSDAALTNEPRYEGEPILAVAAGDEQTAADAVERMVLDLEPLPFVIDPLDSLRSGGPNARTDGNTRIGRQVREIKWTAEDVEGLAAGEIPMHAPATGEWGYGDLDAAFAEADAVVEEPVYSQAVSAQPLESRTTMAYWIGGKLYVYPSVQSTIRAVGPMARYQRVRRGAHQRAHGRRVRQQGLRLSPSADSDPTLEEDRQAGDDASDTARRDVVRSGAAQRAGTDQARHAARR
jgi:CO/xanthine dehydrogenase Mo-binding subunit